MKTRFITLIFSLLLLLPATSYSQFGGVVRRAVNRQVNKEVDSLLDKKVQDQQNANRAKQKEEQQKAEQAAVQNPDKATEDQGNTGNAGSDNQKAATNQGAGGFGLFGGKVTSKYKEEYSFTSRIYMLTEVHDKDEVTKMDYFMFYSSASPVIGIETSTLAGEGSTPLLAKMIMDGENKSFIMLTDINGMKMGMISEIPDENTTITGPDGKPVKKYTPPTFTKTGNTKVIAGYKCDEYTYKTEDKSSGKVWFTKDANLKIDKRGWNNSGMSYYYGSNNFNDGIILATESYNEKGKLETKTDTKEINENFPHSIAVTGYSLRQMNMGQKK